MILQVDVDSFLRVLAPLMHEACPDDSTASLDAFDIIISRMLQPGVAAYHNALEDVEPPELATFVRSLPMHRAVMQARVYETV